MDTRQLRYILEIAEAGSISGAAERLFISQSGLNQQLARIEKELNTTLFQRDTHHLEITESGKLLLDYAREAIAAEKRLHGMIDDIKNSNIGNIRINLAMEQGIELFTQIFPAFHQRYPRISVRLEDRIVSEQYKLLLDGDLDIGMVMITKRELAELEYIHLANERFLLGVPANHALTRFYQPTADGDYPELDLNLCRDEPFSLMFSGSTFREVVDPCFEHAGFKPNIMFESKTNHIIALMVANGICLTILPESQAKLYHNIRWFRLADNPTWESCLIYHQNNPPRKAGRYLIQLAVEHGKFLGNHSTPDFSMFKQ